MKKWKKNLNSSAQKLQELMNNKTFTVRLTAEKAYFVSGKAMKKL